MIEKFICSPELQFRDIWSNRINFVRVKMKKFQPNHHVKLSDNEQYGLVWIKTIHVFILEQKKLFVLPHIAPTYLTNKETSQYIFAHNGTYFLFYKWIYLISDVFELVFNQIWARQSNYTNHLTSSLYLVLTGFC